jgi:hypothetical protein
MSVWVLEAGRYMMTLFGIPSRPGSFPVLRIYILWLNTSRVIIFERAVAGSPRGVMVNWPSDTYISQGALGTRLPCHAWHGRGLGGVSRQYFCITERHPTVTKDNKYIHSTTKVLPTLIMGMGR